MPWGPCPRATTGCCACWACRPTSRPACNLTLAATQPHDFQLESQLYLALIRESYYKQPAEAERLTARLAAEQPDNLLFAYVRMSVAKRQHHADAALAAYRARPAGPGYLPVPYLHHMAADLLLYRGDYAASERENLAFLHESRGQHYRKDAAFKLYLAAWLGGQPAAAMARYRALINQPGPADVEEDTYAQHYYDEARALIGQFDVGLIPHLDNEMTRSMNPLKAFVYCSLGVPIVSTPVANIGEMAEFITIADGLEEFLRAIEGALGTGRQVLDADRLRPHSWDDRVERVLALVDDVVDARPA